MLDKQSSKIPRHCSTGRGFLRLLAGAALTFLVVGCSNAGNKPVEVTADPVALIPCQEPRAQMCIQLYEPVCARLQDGTEKTFSNGCTACADPAVRGYRPGGCE